jgi:hypothetical protein
MIEEDEESRKMAQRARTTKPTPQATAYVTNSPQKVTKRDADRALRDALGPLLRERGFQGTLPHFHRAHPDGEVWVVSVQHDKYGGRFRAELGWVPPRRLFPKLYPLLRSSSSL